jgi:hypothetical protein
MITTTLNRIRAHSPCLTGWEKLLRHLGKTAPDDEPLPFAVIVKSNGLMDALWCTRAEPQHAALWRHFAVDCAERAAHLMTDERSRAALKIARRHALGEASDDELAYARRTAAAAYAYAVADGAAWAAAWADGAAWADAAAITADGAARGAAAWGAERAWQEQRFLTLVNTGEWRAE